jgi:hypothetical protein
VRPSGHDRSDTAAWKIGVIVDCVGPLLIGLVVLAGMIVMAWFATGEPY